MPNNVLRRKYKAILISALIAISGFSVGTVLANRIPVLNVQSLSGERVIVPGAEMVIVVAAWSIDPERSLVTAVNLLVFPNAPELTLKLFAFYVQVSCLDPGPDGIEGTADDVEIICSTGAKRLVLPTRDAGLRRVTVDLVRPVNPETAEIHDLSFIITDFGRVPPTVPGVFGGVTPARVTVNRGTSTDVTIVVRGFLGIPIGTEVKVSIDATPSGVVVRRAGVMIDPQQPITLTLSANQERRATPEATLDLSFEATSEAMIGTAELGIIIQGSDGSQLDNSVFELGIECFNPQPEPPGAC